MLDVQIRASEISHCPIVELWRAAHLFVYLVLQVRSHRWAGGDLRSGCPRRLPIKPPLPAVLCSTISSFNPSVTSDSESRNHSLVPRTWIILSQSP